MYVGISGSRHESRSRWPGLLSNTLPLPTRKKSVAHAFLIWASKLKSAASYSWRTILRPRMPPASLHHFVKTSPASKSSWSRPRRPTKPGSALVATSIELAVTPCADDFVCVPGPHTFFRVPKSPGPAVAASVVVVPDAPGLGGLLLRLHAPAKST